MYVPMKEPPSTANWENKKFTNVNKSITLLSCAEKCISTHTQTEMWGCMSHGENKHFVHARNNLEALV
jgi:hypothetical protein